jgi:flagellar biogenesis protein FliO
MSDMILSKLSSVALCRLQATPATWWRGLCRITLCVAMGWASVSNAQSDAQPTNPVIETAQMVAPTNAVPVARLPVFPLTAEPLNLSAGGSGFSIWRSLGSLLMVLGGLLAVTWWLKKRFGAGSGIGPRRRLQVTDRLSLGQRQYLMIVRFDNRDMLIGVSPGAISRLDATDSLDLPLHTDSEKPGEL